MHLMMAHFVQGTKVLGAMKETRNKKKKEKPIMPR